MENTNKVDKEKKYDPYEIVDYKVINDTVVIVTFADETTEKAVCNKNDTYDFERAIEICICKKKFGGTKEYNTAIKNALRQVKAVDEKKKKEAEEKELAERTGIAQGDISKLENGSANPSLRTLQRLAAGMGMKVEIAFTPLH